MKRADITELHYITAIANVPFDGSRFVSFVSR